MALCVSPALRADNPSFGAYGSWSDTTSTPKASSKTGAVTEIGGPTAAADAASSPADNGAAQGAAARSCVPPCYNDKNPSTKGCPKPSCVAFDKANPSYFSGIDKACQLPAGTAIMMGSVESSCSSGDQGGTYRGMFQFSSSSCGGNLSDPNAQAKCLCDYTANTRKQYAAATGGQTPSAGMYYLFHQQGACGLKLALGGSARAVDVVQACVQNSKSFCKGTGVPCIAKANRYANAAIKGNIPGGSGYSADTISASQFANIYLSKFSQIDNSNVCLGDGTPADLSNIASQAITSAADAANINPQLLSAITAATGALTGDGKPLSMDFVKQILMTQDLSSIFSQLFNPKYEEEAENGSSDDKSGTDTTTNTPSTDTDIDVTDNSDGSKTVKVKVGTTTTTYTVKAGQQLWQCGTAFQVVAVDATITDVLSGRGCQMITAGEAPAATTP